MEEADWDKETDIAIVGYGFAGAISSIVAHDLGNRVVIMEKMPYFGGNSILSGGDFRISNDSSNALKYLKRTSMNTVPEDILEVVAKGFTEIPSFIEQIGKNQGVEFTVRFSGATYHFEGAESLGTMLTNPMKDFNGYDWLTTGPTNRGKYMFRALEKEVSQRNIEVMFSTPVTELITNSDGQVIGVLAEKSQGGIRMRIKARKGVILCSGGFENNEQLKLQFIPAQPIYAICSLGNTGDGILMAQKLGAQLWHMWHIHGSYGFKPPDLAVALRHRFGGGVAEKGVRAMPWIVIDKFGSRYMNEQPRAPQDTPWRDMCYFDANIQDFPRIPSFMLFDEEGRKTGPMFISCAHERKHSYRWSEDNSVEIDKGWIKRAETLEDLAKLISISPEILNETIKKWNSCFDQGEDKEFARPKKSMMPLRTPPYYAVPVWPIVSNTQGGIAHNVKQQVIDVNGNPIPRLYAAGEISSIFGHLYLQAGNDSECVIAGRLAAKYASEEKPWDV